MAEQLVAAPEAQNAESAAPALSARGVRRVALFAAAAFLLLTALAAWQLHRQIVAWRTADAQRAAQVLEEHADKIIGGYLAALEQVDWLVRDLEPLTEERARLLHVRLRAIAAERPEVQSVWLIDPHGYVVATSVQHPPPPNNFADRDFHVSALRGEERHVGRVIFGRVTKEYAFNLSKRLASPGGELTGVLVLSLYPGYFSRFYGSIGAEADSVKLLRADGVVLARHPPLPDDPLTAEAPPEFMARLAEAPGGAFRGMAPFNKGEHIFAYRRLTDLPLYVVYGVSVERITRQWLSLAAIYAGLALPALAGLGFLGFTAHRRALAADASRDALAQANLSLEERVEARTAELRESEARMRTMALEVDHRAKNLLASVQAIATLTRAVTIDEYVAKLTGRLAALSHAHALLAEQRWAGANLRRLLEEEFAAFAGGRSERVALTGPELELAPGAAQALSMTIHELVTNAVKYGALSSPAGRVEVDWTQAADGRTILRWTETGGPAVAAPARQGFGTKLIEATCAQQLRGSVRFDWRPEGLTVEIVMPTDNLNR